MPRSSKTEKERLAALIEEAHKLREQADRLIEESEALKQSINEHQNNLWAELNQKKKAN